MTGSATRQREGSAELALLFACSRWPRTQADLAAVAVAARAVDPHRFVALCRRHRLAGMAADALRSAGAVVPAQLAADERADAAQALRLAGEAIRLTRVLADAGIATTILKGPPLARQIYGTLAVRQTRDLDLMVAPEALAGAAALLRTMGYAPSHAGGDDEMGPDRLSYVKDVEFRHRDTGLLVELHARVAENDALLPVAALGATTAVELAPGQPVAALSGGPMLLYLLVHGFRHGWHRLKWLVDVVTLLRAMDGAERRRFGAWAEAQGLGVVVRSSLLVASRTLARGDGLIDPAGVGLRARCCAWVAERHLRDPREVDHQVVNGLLVTATKLLASSRTAYLRREAGRLLIDPGVVTGLAGRRGAVALAIIARPVVLPLRHLLRLLRRR